MLQVKTIAATGSDVPAGGPAAAIVFWEVWRIV
jgi:hypothetical protein